MTTVTKVETPINKPVVVRQVKAREEDETETKQMETAGDAGAGEQTGGNGDATADGPRVVGVVCFKHSRDEGVWVRCINGVVDFKRGRYATSDTAVIDELISRGFEQEE